MLPRRVRVGRGKRGPGDQPAYVILPGDGRDREADGQVEDDQEHDPPAVQPQPPGQDEPGAEQAEDGTRSPQRRLVRRGEEVVQHRPAQRTEHIDGQETQPPEHLLQRRANHDQRPHVEDDVGRAEPAQPGLMQERRREQPVPLVVRHAHGLVDGRVVGRADHVEVVDDPRVHPFDQVTQDVQADQHPGDDGARGHPAAEYRRRPPDTAIALVHAFDAVLADRRGPQAVRAGRAPAPAAGQVSLPVRMPETGRNRCGRLGARRWKLVHFSPTDLV